MIFQLFFIQETLSGQHHKNYKNSPHGSPIRRHRYLHLRTPLHSIQLPRPLQHNPPLQAPCNHLLSSTIHSTFLLCLLLCSDSIGSNLWGP
ncbi:hypothetical protein Mapa_013805 [Marchantia paleacea]|nr:hypothetical protein Mapa_013805 [Marchantia paleacea]